MKIATLDGFVLIRAPCDDSCTAHDKLHAVKCCKTGTGISILFTTKMKINQQTKIHGSLVVLVPYRDTHVLK